MGQLMVRPASPALSQTSWVGPKLVVEQNKHCTQPDSLSLEGLTLHPLFLKHAPWESHPLTQMANSNTPYGILPEKSSDKFHFLHLIFFPLLF